MKWEESFAFVAYRNATSRVLNASHRMIALNAETYALGRLVGGDGSRNPMSSAVWKQLSSQRINRETRP